MYPSADNNLLPPVVPDLQDDAPVIEEEEIVEEVNTISDEELANALTDLLRSAREEDRFQRDESVRLWKRLEYYWNNILDIFLDPVARDWRIPDWDTLEGETPPRLINIYRPHGEAIVAALSVAIPAVIFHPDDADNPDDIEAAKSYRSIVELLALHNDAPMLFIKVIVILFNQGTVFGYNYYHEHPKFGTFPKPKIESKDFEVFKAHCPQCGAPLDAGIKSADVDGQPQELYQCEMCGYQGPADVSNEIESIPQIVGFNETPKGSICQELFSGLNVKVPGYVKKQEECGYILLEFIQSTAMLRSIFRDHADKIASKRSIDYDGFSRLPVQYLGELPDNAANVSCLWLRPWQFWDLGKDKATLLEEKYPKGCYAIFVNDEFMEAHEEEMDEHWTISSNPLGSFLQAKPLGENLATVQDLRAQLVEIEIQTAEYGIPETFADGGVLDFNKYGEGRAQPGMVTQVKARSGKSVADAFHTTKSAILSQEIDPLRQHLDNDGQFVSGSFPSIYGGDGGGSKTASEYSQSRAMALQRLGTTWKIVCEFWSNFQSRSAVEYANTLRELGRDEKFSKKNGNGGYVNSWIKHSSLTGRIGRVEPESSEQLPISWAQKKDTIFQFLQSGVDEVIGVLTHPNNASIIKNATGLPEIYIPGEESRLRQQAEFVLLSQGVPVPTNPLVDNEEVHIEVLKSILESPIGESLSPEAMQVSMMHLMEHTQSVSMKMAAQPEVDENGNEVQEKKPKQGVNQ